MAIQDVPIQHTQSTQSTQRSTQSTQEASQSTFMRDGEIWGSLIPLNPYNDDVSRIDFLKTKSTYTIGRSRQEFNNVCFPRGPIISQVHCTIEWDGEETSDSAIVVKDLSSNGTYINDRPIGKNCSKLLRDSNIISFGPPCNPERSKREPKKDYRFVFRHMACRISQSEGIYSKYDVTCVIGKGAFATVVKALHNVEGKWYAIKMFPGDPLREMLSRTSPGGFEMETTARHLKREFYILQRLKHRNICQLKEAFFEGYGVSIVLELAAGGDLMRYVATREVLLEVEAQYITYQVCDALAYLHKRGVVHRDLKPENVLLTDDTPPIVKVADFGLANVIDSLSKLQTRCGTPAYAAPEVMDSSQTGYDEAVDSWSLGVMVFYTLTSCSPFHDDSRGHRPDWELLHENNIVGEAEDFLQRLLEYKPERRMKPAQALCHAWLASQAERRRRERERSRSQSSAAMTVHASSVPTTTAMEPDRAGPSGGVKRKAKVVELNRSLSSLSMDEKESPPRKKKERVHVDEKESPPRKKKKRVHVDEKESPPRKKNRVHVGVHTAPRRSPSRQPVCTMMWPVYDGDPNEIPGLGQLRHS